MLNYLIAPQTNHKRRIAMKKPLILLSILLCCAMGATAAPPKGEGEGPLCPQIMADLHLTEEQAKQFQDIMNEQHAKMLALHEETRDRLTRVLNDEQLKKFDTMHQYHGREHYMDRMHHGYDKDGEMHHEHGEHMHHPDCPLKDKKPKKMEE